MNTELMREITGQSWAILASALDRIAGLSAQATPAELQAAMGRPRASKPQGAIAVIPIVGVIRPKPSQLEAMLGIELGTTLESFMGQFREAMADESVKSVVLAVDSPGGMAQGVSEAASEMHDLKKRKKVVAVAEGTMASAAYWLSSQAHEIIGTPSAMIGSIGVLGTHVDLSAQAEAEGVKVTLISAGKNKTQGHPFEPLTLEAKASMQALIDEQYDLFIKAVASGRNVSQKAVREGYAEGGVLGPSGALEAGMIDRIGTFRDTIMGMGGGEMRAEGSDFEISAGNSGVISEAEMARTRRRFQLAKR